MSITSAVFAVRTEVQLQNGICRVPPSKWDFVDFLHPVFSASRVQHISDMHSKSALRPHHVWKYVVLLRFQNVSFRSVSVGFPEKTSVFGSV